MHNSNLSMKTKAICSFFVLFAIVAGIGATTPAAFAEVTIEPVAGSGVPGCEDEPEGCWFPNTATVDVGEVVIFSNTDNAAHTWTAGSPSDGPSDVFDTSLLTIDATYEWIPDTAGEFPYFCMVHPWMQGTIIVQEAEAEEVMEEETMMEETVEEEVMEETMEEEVMEETMEEEVMMEETVEDSEGGGCLIFRTSTTSTTIKRT